MVVCFYFVLVGPGFQDIVVVVGCWLLVVVAVAVVLQNQTRMNTYIYTT